MAGDRRRKRERRDDSFEVFVASRRRALVGYAYALVGDMVLAEDIAADAVAKAWSSLRDREVDQLELYVRRVIVNLVISRQRRQQIARRHEPTRRDDWRLSDDTGDVFDIAVLEHDDLMRALAALSVDQRTVIVTRFLLDMTEADTAALLGIPTGTVKSRVARGSRVAADDPEPRR